MTIKHLNPAGMHRNPAFSQGTILEGAGRLLVVGGQNAVAADGSIVGDDVGTQTRQALRNVLAVLAEAGATQQDVAKLTIYLAAGEDAREGFAASQDVWGNHPTAVTVLQVAALGRPEFLVEIEALAQVGDDAS